MTALLNVAVALEGAGWHPAAWFDRPAPMVLSGRYWSDLANTAERGLLDFLTIGDGPCRQRHRQDTDPLWLAARPDAVLVASRVAPATSHIGLVPVANVSHAEPFNLSKAIATLDIVSGGRAGWQPRVSNGTHEALLFGRGWSTDDELLAEAADFVEVVRRLWDSWEDDAVIRDVASGRYVDRDKLHYIDFSGDHFSIKGPSITPRPPQGQPVVAVSANGRPSYEFASRNTDLVFITPSDDADLKAMLGGLAEAGGAHLKVFADVYVTSTGLMDYRPAAAVAGSGAEALVDLMLRWQRLGAAGVRLCPAVNAIDLPFIADEVMPLLRDSGAFRSDYADGSLRARLGLPVAPNRYAKSMS